MTKLSASLRITRGGVCKIIKRLSAKHAVSPYKLDENKKEIYYTLTETGEKIFLAHEKIHQTWLEKDSDFLKQFNKKDVEFALKFIQEYSDHLKKSLTGFEWRKK